ncbi:MAG TPA: AgmX/PglI C-terminal domain-containing protein [Myxococcaceae bacterium]|nr:AgmX/PglI C-terminal domain-containing protein [Myxococcaceae bacterium]
MNFSCDKCGRKYSLADERVGDKGVKIRCKHCQNLIVVKPPPEVGAEESTRMVSLAELQRGGVAGAAAAKPVPTPSRVSGGAPAKGGGGGKSQRTEVGAPPEPPSSTGAAASPWEGEATRAVVAPDPNAQWFAMVKGQQVGPFDLRGLSGKMKQGEVGLKTFVWREGMDDWKRAEELPELALMFAGGTAREERAGAAAMKVEAVKSIAAALQKSAAGAMRTSSPKPARGGEPVEEPRRVPMAEASPDEMWPAEADPDNLGAPMSFDLSVDGDAGPADGVDIPGLGEPQELDLMATAATLAEAASAPVTPVPSAPAPALSSAAAVTVTPGPTRRNPRKSKEATPAPIEAVDAAPAPELESPHEPATVAAPANGDLTSDLFSDLDLRRSGEHARPLDPGDLTRTADEPSPTGNGEAKGDADPFAKMGKIPVSMLPKPGMATNFAIAEAGVEQRNPAWKIALFVLLLIGLPVGVLYALSEMNVVPLQITHVDQATGATVTDNVFSSGGVSGLRDLLMGKRAAAPAPVPPRDPKDPREQKDAKDPAGTQKVTPASKDGAHQKQLADLYQDGKKKDVGPTAAKPDPVEEHPEAVVGGPAKEEINKVVEATQRAFQFCIEQELKKNPGFKGGKVRLVATVGASGVVKKASIDREDIDQSDLGECLKGKAKRMTFSAFTGDDVDLEIPLILSTTM